MPKYRIQELMAANGDTPQTLSRKVGMTTTLINSILEEKGNPKISQLEKIAEALNVPISAIFADVPSPKSPVIICPDCGARINVYTGKRL